MTPTAVRTAGLACAGVYVAFIAWVYTTQPSTVSEMTGGVASAVGAYRIDPDRFAAGLRFFRNYQFVEARDALSQADPARRDPVVQYYIAYSFLREGWGRLYNDDALYEQGLAALRRAREVAPGGTVRVDDPGLTLHTAEELEAELRRGLTHDLSDLDPRKAFRSRP
jgi:hypothetical protein